MTVTLANLVRRPPVTSAPHRRPHFLDRISAVEVRRATDAATERAGGAVVNIAGRFRSWLRNRPLLHRAASSVVVLVTGPYEARFERALLKALQGAHCFWDVGANVGGYVCKAREQRVPTVVAIEPSVACCEQLRMLPVAPVVIEAALSDADGLATFSVSAGPLAVSNHLTGTTDQEGVGVRTFRADTLIEQGVPTPDVIKMDVEGFEGEVLDGMPLLLQDRTLKTVCMEVHFAQLHDRGMGGEPARIVNILRAAGFRVRWVDPSHLIATRPLQLGPALSRRFRATRSLPPFFEPPPGAGASAPRTLQR